MKKLAYIFSLLALLVGSLPISAQESKQYALYNYRNDGDFNAFLNIDVDSITYSCFDLDSVEHEDIVVQEVWTPDSVYRIPIEVIDSIGFRAPEPEFKEGIFYIGSQHLPYIKDADDLTITFIFNTPTDLLPSKGQIIYSDLEDEPFYMGFAGRVIEVKNTSEGIIYKCESVSPSEVYDRYLDVFKVIPSEEIIEDISQIKDAPRKVIRKNIHKDGTITAPDIRINVGFKNYLNLDAKISNTFDYVISVGVTSKDFIKITHTKKINYSVKTSVKSDDLVDLLTSSEDGDKKYSPEPIWLPYSYPLVGCKFLQVYLNCGLYFEAKGSFELSAKLPYSSTSVDEYYFSSDNNWMPVHTESNEGGWPGWSEFLTDGEVEFKLKGSAAFGPIVALGISAWKPKFCSLSVQAKGGLELSGECSVNLKDIALGDFSVYKLLSEDTKITTGLNLGVELVASVKSKDYKIASLSTTICKREKYLLPKFSTPEIPQYIGNGWKNGLSPLSIYTNPSNDLLLPGKVGIGVYDSQGTIISETYPYWYFGDGGLEDNSLRYDVSHLSPGQTYTIRPLFSLLSLLDIKASPKTNITVPPSVSLDTSSITIQNNKGQRVAINGGWGDYSIFNSNTSVCRAELTREDNSYYITVFGLSSGASTITLTDLRTSEKTDLFVNVTEDDIPPQLTLSTTSLSVDARTSNRVQITSGSGSYTAVSDHPEIATASVYDSNIAIEAYAAGTAIITVTDTQSGQTATIAVTVVDALPDLALSTSTVSLTVGAASTVDITSGSGSYTVASDNSSVATAALSGTTLTITPISAGTATITVTDTYSGQTATIAVMVTADNPTIDAIAVDLGLPSGTKWADRNVGASSPEDYGGYYAWGETEEKEVYDWSSYKWCNGSETTQTKYCTNSDYGTVDNNTVLDPEDDVAHVKWGGAWKMPTEDQMKELMDNCTSEWTTVNGVNGRRFTGPNGNSIFLPAAGGRSGSGLNYPGSDGCYWSSTLIEGVPYNAYGLSFTSGAYWRSGYFRNFGQSVRPVISISSNLTLSTTTVSLKAGYSSSTVEITAGSGNYTVVSNKPSVTTANLRGTTITVIGVAAGTATITVTDTESGQTATIAVTVTAADNPTTDAVAVDLGLPSGTKWADRNVGASKPEDYGGYYAWGETEEKEVYNWSTYKLCDGSYRTLTKYCTDTRYWAFNWLVGSLDNKTMLDPEDDVAQVEWGGAWKMPTYDQVTELEDNCTSEWTSLNGINGCKFTGPNGNSIFIPAAGIRDNLDLRNVGSYGYYWSSSLSEHYPLRAHNLGISSGGSDWYFERYYGYSIRPVCK